MRGSRSSGRPRISCEHLLRGRSTSARIITGQVQLHVALPPAVCLEAQMRASGTCAQLRLHDFCSHCFWLMLRWERGHQLM